MRKPESFVVVRYAAIDTSTVLLTKNCTPRRAMRLWNKFLKKHYNYPPGTYVVTNDKKGIEATSFRDLSQVIV